MGTPEESQKHRKIRSFVLREGRITAGQQRAFDTLWPRFGIQFQGQPLDLPALFGNTRPVTLEIGFGDGESLARIAANHPQRNYLGIEVHRPGVGHLLLKAEQLGLTNLRLMRHDAVEILTHGLSNAALDGLFLFFPDPWHKKRHHKRRILNAPFLDQLARILTPSGVFHAATDWENYAEQMMQLLSSDDRFENLVDTGQFSPRPDYRPLTKFEQRGQRLGHGVWDLRFRRR